MELKQELTTRCASWRRDFGQALFRPVDVAALATFRIWFGLMLMWEVKRYFERDWIYTDFIGPKIHFTYYGFHWVRVWPGLGMYYHFAALGVAAFCVTIGFAYRSAAIALCLLFGYVFLLDQTYYLNHFYLVCLLSFLMVFLPAHRALSVDAWVRHSVRASSIPAWTSGILRVQLAIVYIFAAIAKLDADWLRGEPLRMWLADRADVSLLGNFLPIGRYFTQEWCVYGMAYGGFLFDLLIVPLLLCRVTRWWGLAWCAAFHLANSLLFHIGIFPSLMMGATLLFLGDDWPRWVFNWPRRAQEMGTTSRRGSRAVVVALALYVVLQIAVPLRHFAYRGPVSWTEEGHRFSWHMKLRDKDADAEFRVIGHDSSLNELVELGHYLTDEQRRKMAGRPDMLLQFAHYIADIYERRGGTRPAVRARVVCSLNDRPPQLLIDPDVDLAAKRRNLWPADWILPLDGPTE